MVGAVLYPVAKKMNETHHIIKVKVSRLQWQDVPVVTNSIPSWVTTLWILAEVAGAGYAAIEGYHGFKHLLKPDHNLDAPNTNEISAKKSPTHIRVKREHA